MVTENKFRVGQWVRTKSDGNVWRIDRDDGGTLGLLFHGQGEKNSTWSALPEEVEPWAPRPDERVRVTKCESMPETIGMVGKFQPIGIRAIQLIRDEGPQWNFCPGDVEFEPVFEEPECETPRRGDHKEIGLASGRAGPADVEANPELAAGEQLDRLLRLLGFPGRESGETDSQVRERVRQFSEAFNRFEVPLRPTPPGYMKRFKRPGRAIQEPTHPTRPSRAARDQAKLAQVREQLGGKWAGRTERK